MKITYDDFSQSQQLTYLPETGQWSGDDLQLVNLLNNNPHAVIGRHEYYPSTWHLVKAIADALEGTLDEPEPKLKMGGKKAVY